jgi:hypothetical protein
MTNDLENWASKLTEEVYEKWKDYGRPEYGFKTFVTPVKKNPAFLIIGYNPGVGKGENTFKTELLPRFESGNFSPPSSDEENEILNPEYTLASKLKDVVFRGYEELLRDSVKYDMYFFRSRGQGDLKDQLGDNYSQMREYCLEENEEIINKIDPDYVLVYGVKTFQDLEKHFADFEEKDREKDNNNNTFYMRAKWGDRDIFGMAHPSGPNPVSNENLGKVLDLIFSYKS